MTEAFTKKATHILDQATSKDNLGEFGIAYKLYCDGIEYFQTAIRFEHDEMVKHEMMEIVQEYKLRIDYLDRWLHTDRLRWADIVPIYDFERGMLVRLSVMETAEENEEQQLEDGEPEDDTTNNNAVKETTDQTVNPHQRELRQGASPKACCFGFFWLKCGQWFPWFEDNSDAFIVERSCTKHYQEAADSHRDFQNDLFVISIHFQTIWI